MTRIAVVGGGIAGLSLAAALDPDATETTVYESQPERSALGAGLVIWPAALRALTRIGAWDLLRADATPVPPAAIRALSGRILLRTRETGMVIVPRPALLAALHAVLPDSVQVVAREVTDARALDADIVVGADGVRSVMRGLVAPRVAERRATPYAALRGTRSTVPVEVAGEYWGRGGLFGIVPMGAGAYWFTTHRSGLGPEPLDAGALIGEAQAVFAGAAPVIAETLAAAAPDTLATRLWITPPLPRYRRDRYVVIGDAAHAMTPNLGRGACDAIVDAVTLAGALRTGHVAAWEARRLPVTQAARALSGGIMRMALSGIPSRRR